MVEVKTREKWLETAIEKLIPIFVKAKLTLPKRINILCDKEDYLKLFGLLHGMCWTNLSHHPESATIWISHFLRCVRGKHGILAILTHELVHAIVGVRCGHGIMFRRTARRIGLVKSDCGGAGKRLRVKLKNIADKLGPIPSSKLLIRKELFSHQTNNSTD